MRIITDILGGVNSFINDTELGYFWIGLIVLSVFIILIVIKI